MNIVNVTKFCLIALFSFVFYDYAYGVKTLINKTPFSIEFISYKKLSIEEFNLINEMYGYDNEYDVDKSAVIEPYGSITLDKNYKNNIEYYIVDYYLDMLVDNFIRKSINKNLNFKEIKSVIKKYYNDIYNPIGEKFKLQSSNIEVLKTISLRETHNLETITFKFDGNHLVHEFS
ncbi:MAG: hypothetical protein HRT87_06260 [Legionellales bacterium]|nr:hypothetical protein [Legionellales bacterium]